MEAPGTFARGASLPLAVLLLLAAPVAGGRATPAAAGMRDDYRACAKNVLPRLPPGSDATARTAADQYCLALGYSVGKPPFPRDPARAAALLRGAAAQGHAGAQTALGDQHERGMGVLQDRYGRSPW
jgi:TPR repeat protein